MGFLFSSLLSLLPTTEAPQQWHGEKRGNHCVSIARVFGVWGRAGKPEAPLMKLFLQSRMGQLAFLPPSAPLLRFQTLPSLLSCISTEVS